MTKGIKVGNVLGLVAKYGLYTHRMAVNNSGIRLLERVPNR